MGNRQSRLTGFSLAVLLAAIVGISAAQAAADLRVLHSFCKKVNCGDGESPRESLVMDQAGDLFGTAAGGVHGNGVVFELIPQTDVHYWQYKVLHQFCALQSCSDGRDPTASTLVVDTAGNIYGTTSGGGAAGDTGTVFRLSPRPGGKGWVRTTLYSFCLKARSCQDGLNPGGGLEYAGREAGLPYDGVSPLYGTTTGGGRWLGGVAYALKPNPNGSWSNTVLYDFCNQGIQSCPDGRAPIERLAMDTAGNLYGVTQRGGKNDTGVAFKLSPQVGQELLSETVLYDFWRKRSVVSGLSIDQNNHLFGSSVSGGKGPACQQIPFPNGCGFLFKIDAKGRFSVLYNFCSLPNCADGVAPFNGGGILVDNRGGLYGSANGGLNGEGVLFKLKGGSEQVIYNFCSKTGCSDGGFSRSGLIANAGRIYGATDYRGYYGSGGTVFRLTP